MSRLNKPDSLSLSLLTEMLHPSDHLCGPPLDLLEQVHVGLVLVTPELYTLLQVRSLKSRVKELREVDCLVF